MKSAVTIKQIAEAAGVSTATVSNVIHGKTKRVSPATIAAVQALIQQMGYRQVSAEERDEKRKPLPLIALVVNAHKVFADTIAADPFYGKIIGMAEQSLKEKGYYMLFYAADDMDEIVQMVVNREVDGIIALTFSRNDCDKIASLCRCPVVSIDAYGTKGSVPNIGLDDWQGGYAMGNYLLECGYTNIYVCANRDYGVDHQRYIGCLEAFRAEIESKKKNHQVRFVPLGMNPQSRKKAWNQLIKQVQKEIAGGSRPALFCLSDLYALEVLNFSATAGIKVPRQVGIAGFDDIFYASVIHPGLTTIRQNMKEKARLAVAYVTDNQREEIKEDVLLPVRLIVRGTTAAESSE